MSMSFEPRRGVVVLVSSLAAWSVACGGGETSQIKSGDPGGTGGASSSANASSGTATGGGSGAGTGGSSGSGFFPAGSWIYEDISGSGVASDSAVVTQWLADNGGWGTGEMRMDFSIEVLEASESTPNLAFEPTGDFYDPDCDQVPVPVPDGGALEGEAGYECTTDGDCHLIVVDHRDERLYEMWRANITGGTFYGGCLAAWDMTRVYPPENRGEQCSSADAAGFPIAPLLFTADEVAAGAVDHVIRFILPNARMRGGFYVRPASHAGGPSGPLEAPVYGSRWRLRADFDLASLPSEGARVVARGLQKYGMALADGGNIALTGRADRSTTAKWEGLLDTHDLASIQPTDFEVIDTGAPIVLTYDCVRGAY